MTEPVWKIWTGLKNINWFKKYEPVWKIWTSLKKFELEVNLNHNIAVGVFSVELLAFQWSALQIGQDSSIYLLDVILGWVYDVISHILYIIQT